MPVPHPYGLLAAFASPEELVTAATQLRETGYTALDAFTPYRVPELGPILELPNSRIPVFAFIGGALGAAGIMGLQLYSTLVNYPINVGGRPLASWTAFAVPGFECAILGGALVAFFGMLAGNRLPQLYHPVFNAQAFSLANGDRFYLMVGGNDPQFDRGRLRRLFRTLKAVAVEEVAP
jgi:hypothetical protein